MKRIVLILFVAIIVGLLPSCTSINIDTGDVEISVEEEKLTKGGSIVLGCIEPKGLNPITNKSKSYFDISKLLFLSLYEYDKNLKLQPVLAESIQSSPNGECIVKLKDNIYWSDGQKITAHDVRFTLDNIIKAADSLYKSNVQNIKYYKILDDNTIRIFFSRYSPDNRGIFTFPILPYHVLSEDIDSIPVTSAMFKISKYTPTKNMELLVNDYYTGDKPNIESIKVVFINDIEAFSSAFTSKELDVLNTTAYDWEKYKEMQGVKTFKYPTSSFECIFLNQKNTIFTQKGVRTAIMYGINRRAILEKYLLGNAVLTDTPMLDGSWISDGLGVKYIYSKKDAMEALTEAGYSKIETNKRLYKMVEDKKESLSFSLIVNKDNIFRVQACEDIKKDLEEIGMDVKIIELSFEEYTRRLQEGEYDAAFGGYNLSPDFNLEFAFSSISDKNISSYMSEELNALFAKANGAVDDIEKKQAYKEIQKHFREEVPCISIAFREAAIVANYRVAAEIKPDMVNPFRNINEWYVKKSK